MPKALPIIRNAEQVRMLLAGATQIRVPVRTQPTRSITDHTIDAEPGEVVMYRGYPHRIEQSSGRNQRDSGILYPRKLTCPFGLVGDRLLVQEEVATDGPWNMPETCNLWYPADGGEQPARHQRRSAANMPRCASRITLELTEDSRAERVQTISESDARAEGITDGGCLTCGRSEPCRCDNPRPDARDAFIHYWDASYADKGYPWIGNPWTWVARVKGVIHEQP